MKPGYHPKLSESILTSTFVSTNTNKDTVGTFIISELGIIEELITLGRLEQPRSVEERGQGSSPQLSKSYSNMHMRDYWSFLRPLHKNMDSYKYFSELDSHLIEDKIE